MDLEDLDIMLGLGGASGSDLDHVEERSTSTGDGAPFDDGKKWISWEEWSIRSLNKEFDEIRARRGLKPDKYRERQVQLHLRACGLKYDEELLNEYDRDQQRRADFARARAEANRPTPGS
jgi:hypothetical protein